MAPVLPVMSSRFGTLVVLLLLMQIVPLALLAPAPAVEAQGGIVIGPDEHVVWENGTRNLTTVIEIFGRLTVRDYELRFNLSVDGEASFRVMEGGLLEFDNTSLLHDNLSRYFFFKVEGTFIAKNSEIDWLTGQFVTGGGIKVEGGTVELYDTYLHDCEVQGVYVKGNGGTALLDNCTLERMQYGVHVTDGGKATLRNGCVVNGFTRAGMLVNFAEAEISDSSISSDTSGNSQGVAARSSQITLEDTSISDVLQEGVELADGSSGSITDCTIRNCTVGIRMDDSSAEILRTSVTECVDGLNLFLSDPTVTDCSLVDNFNGVSSKDCSDGYSLDNCVIARNSQYGIYAIGKGLSETGTVWELDGEGNGIARAIQWWTLDVNVTDKDAIPISSAKVVIRFDNGTKVTNRTTDALGSVRDIVLEGHRIANDGTMEEQGKYQIYIEKGERFAEKGVSMDKDKVLTVILGDEPDITESGWFWAIPVIVGLLIIVVGAYWYFRIR